MNSNNQESYAAHRTAYLVYKPLPFVQGRAYLSNIRSAILESPRILKNPPSYYHTTPTFSDQTQRTFISPSTLPSTVQRSTSTSMIRVSQYQKLLRFVFLAGIAGTMTRVFGAPSRRLLGFVLVASIAGTVTVFGAPVVEGPNSSLSKTGPLETQAVRIYFPHLENEEVVWKASESLMPSMPFYFKAAVLQAFPGPEFSARVIQLVLPPYDPQLETGPGCKFYVRGPPICGGISDKGCPGTLSLSKDSIIKDKEGKELVRISPEELKKSAEKLQDEEKEKMSSEELKSAGRLKEEDKERKSKIGPHLR
ncbi:hypothetical protein F5880DRAFT_1096642 [Lentinula raphanica]|nr:hypothetical protein F5880DRAFT_1096642 [Lentinula raphanica]